MNGPRRQPPALVSDASVADRLRAVLHKLGHSAGSFYWLYSASNSRMGNPASTAIDLETTVKGEREEANALLIHDRDTKFTSSFDTLFWCEGIEIIRTPYGAPKANAFAERWIRSAREECLDRVLILGEEHLRRVLREYVDYYNRARPHQAIEQRCPQRCPIPIESVRSKSHSKGPVKCRNVLGGIIHDYYHEVA